MHGALLGVSKALMRYWLDSKNRNEPFFIGQQIALLDQRLLKIQIPDFISRRQRSLTDHAHWKGIQSQTMNVHFLGHYAHFARMYGPLYAYSCFGFESMNSYLKSMVHGTGHVNSQVCFAVGISKQISSLVRVISDGADEEIKQLVSQLSSKITGIDLQNAHQGEDVHLGKTKKMQQTHKYYNLLPQDIQASGPLTFMRLRHRNTIFYCEEYQSARMKNSYTVVFEDLDQEEKIGVVQCYGLSAAKTFAVVRICNKEPFTLTQEMKDSINNAVLKQFVNGPLCSHICMVVPDIQTNTVIVPTKNIKTKCVFMDNFISCAPNLVEHG